MTSESKKRWSTWLLVLGALPMLIFTVATFRFVQAMFDRANNQSGAFDLGGGFAGLFAVIVFPVAVVFVLALIMSRLPHFFVYWLGAIGLIFSGAGVCLISLAFIPTESTPHDTWGATLMLMGGALSLWLAAITGIIGWRWRGILG